MSDMAAYEDPSSAIPAQCAMRVLDERDSAEAAAFEEHLAQYFDDHDKRDSDSKSKQHDEYEFNYEYDPRPYSPTHQQQDAHEEPRAYSHSYSNYNYDHHHSYTHTPAPPYRSHYSAHGHVRLDPIRSRWLRREAYQRTDKYMEEPMRALSVPECQQINNVVQSGKVAYAHKIDRHWIKGVLALFMCTPPRRRRDDNNNSNNSNRSDEKDAADSDCDSTTAKDHKFSVLRLQDDMHHGSDALYVVPVYCASDFFECGTVFGVFFDPHTETVWLERPLKFLGEDVRGRPFYDHFDAVRDFVYSDLHRRKSIDINICSVDLITTFPAAMRHLQQVCYYYKYAEELVDDVYYVRLEDYWQSTQAYCYEAVCGTIG